jgi:uncharacterized protein (DUF952 family)
MTIYHLAHATGWEAARVAGEYLTSSRGVTLHEVGFIHASTDEQLPGVAEAFYADDPQPLVVLSIDEGAVTDLRWENIGDGRLFPHIYGPILPEWVTEVRPAGFVDGRFAVSG